MIGQKLAQRYLALIRKSKNKQKLKNNLVSSKVLIAVTEYAKSQEYGLGVK